MENKVDESRLQHQRNISLRRRLRVVLVAMPFQGHLNPIIDLSTILHSRGFPITIAHLDLSPPDPSAHPEFDYLLFGSSSRSFSTTNGFWGNDNNIVVARVADLILNVNDRCRESFRRALEALIKNGEDNEEVGCLIYDQYFYAAQDVARDLNLKAVGLRTGSGVSLLPFAGSVPEAEEEPDEQSIVMEDVYKSIQQLKAPSFSGIRDAVNKALVSSAAILVNTTEFLEYQALKKAQHYFPAPILPIGPFHKYPHKKSSHNGDLSCISWLDKQRHKSVLYVSFGSIASISATEFIEIAWGLEASKQPLLWVMRKGLVHGVHDWKDMLPEKLVQTIQERSCIVSWAPQKRVLAHPAVGGFWSHCGWNSTLESVSEGVPVMCRPFFGDQLADTRYITDVWKVGLELKSSQFERGEIERCIRRLMEEKEGEEMRARAVMLKDKSESVWGGGGSSEKNLNRLEHLILSGSRRPEEFPKASHQS